VIPILIPAEFDIFAKTYKIKMYENLVLARNAEGRTRFRTCQINLQKMTGSDYPRLEVERVYLHELAHVILHEIGRADLGEDEQFIELFSNAFHQVLSSGRGGEITKTFSAAAGRKRQ